MTLSKKQLVVNCCKIFFVLLIMIQSCTHDPILAPVDEDPIPVDTSAYNGCDSSILYFNRDVLPIFTRNCAIAGCHDKRTAEEGYVLTEFNTIIKKGLTSGKPGNSKIYQVISSTKAKDIMPPAPYKPLTTNEIKLINQWITQGLKNDTCVATSNCDTLSVTFSKSVLPIFQGYCVGCHGSITSYSGIRLDNYSFVKEALSTGRPLGAIRWEPGYIRMPLDQSQLLGCDIKKIEIWVRNGAKND